MNHLKLALRQLALRPGLSAIRSVIATAVGVLAAVVLAGSWLPARRASRIAPTEALRYE